MKKLCALVVSILAGGYLGIIAHAEDPKQTNSGEKLFNLHCAVCHPQGGNIINPQKTLNKKDCEVSGIKTVPDIIKIIRNGGGGMQKFDANIIPDNDAKKIAQYILKTFK